MTFAIKICFGPKIIFLTEVSKSFGTHITEEPPRHLVRIVFGWVWDQMGQKLQYLAKDASLRPNLAVFGQKLHFLGGWSKTFGILISGNQ